MWSLVSIRRGASFSFWCVKSRSRGRQGTYLAIFLLREGVSETVGDMRVGVDGCEGKGEAWVHLLGCESVFMFSTMREAGVILDFLDFSFKKL